MAQANPKEAILQLRFLPSSSVKMVAEANCASSFAFALVVIVDVWGPGRPEGI